MFCDALVALWVIMICLSFSFNGATWAYYIACCGLRLLLDSYGCCLEDGCGVGKVGGLVCILALRGTIGVVLRLCYDWGLYAVIFCGLFCCMSLLCGWLLIWNYSLLV